MALEVYSSRDVNITWGGYTIRGFAADGFITITPNSDLTDEEVGADGQLQTSLMPDQTGTVVIQLQQNSPSSLDLQALLAIQRGSGRNLLKGALSVVDPSGSVPYLLKGAYLKGRPELTRGSTATGNTESWTFFCEEMLSAPIPEGVAQEIIDASGDRVAAAIATLQSNL